MTMHWELSQTLFFASVFHPVLYFAIYLGFFLWFGPCRPSDVHSRLRQPPAQIWSNDLAGWCYESRWEHLRLRSVVLRARTILLSSSTKSKFRSKNNNNCCLMVANKREKFARIVRGGRKRMVGACHHDDASIAVQVSAFHNNIPLLAQWFLSSAGGAGEEAPPKRSKKWGAGAMTLFWPSTLYCVLWRKKTAPAQMATIFPIGDVFVK